MRTESGRGSFDRPLAMHRHTTVRAATRSCRIRLFLMKTREVLYAPLQVIATLFTISHAVRMPDISFLRIGLMLLLRLYPTSVILFS